METQTLKLNIVERLNLLSAIKAAGSSFRERKVLDNFVPKVEFSNEEIERGEIHKEGENTFNPGKDFEKEIEVIGIEAETLKRVILDFAEESKCITGRNKSLFYKIDDLIVEKENV
ncbi:MULTISPECIES: hypothetical protein [Butyricimonas]|uniref:hypothetical protein n=1 Tax=Butyricimonas TaxID=574697 RepID=UPI0007FB3238|nr:MULTISPECIES: hypothetical protein [Butyricimonas]